VLIIGDVHHKSPVFERYNIVNETDLRKAGKRAARHLEDSLVAKSEG